ncbi:MAG: response regulator [Gemmataceae bacterium]|nr:response regulator [Gemmataceae bacterium]MCS7269754.1 response regulator [Gemmataceae bacterium]MDW8244145.1 response regulator [Thermogemmata sp.]
MSASTMSEISKPTPSKDFVVEDPAQPVSAIQKMANSKEPRQVLVADDDPISARVLEATLRRWGYVVTIARDGLAAWEILQQQDCPRLAILDWMMPGLEGPEICRRVRALHRPVPTYIILLTAKGNAQDIVAGLESGADDYVTKPFDQAELHSRLRVGERIVELQQGLADRVRELEEALSQVKTLKGLLPICAYCMKIRDDRNYWQRVETYIAAHSNARFSHGICPECWKKVVEPELKREDYPII